MRRAACRWASVAALAAISVLASTAARAASLHLYSYDPADQPTREASGGLTFEVRKGLMHSTVLSLMATEAKASAPLRKVDAGALGRGGLAAALGPAPAERDIYQVVAKDEGPALISALCPGSKRAWLAFGVVRFDGDLKVDVIGDQAGRPVRLCRTLAFNFHGEWTAPATSRLVRERDLPHGRFPGT
ncbi:MAG TPA: hypothetical protein VG248_16770 [Caulobacteraceae bacterium]|jgi:hypothetical protein|nr:hypothetical protein [Caulobacteraceae bacterium]